MIRWATILVTVAACARSGPPPARLFAEGTGECPDKSGCGVPQNEEPKYAPPDEGHGLPDDPNLGPAESREASCTDVGISAASLEVGNYASEEERAPVARRYRARCVRTRLDRAERQCVFEAPDDVTVAYCAPRFWPNHVVDIVDTTTCAAITQQIRLRTGAAPEGQLGERKLAALQQSCEEDRWTAAFGQCAGAMQSASYVVPYCQHVAPAPLLTRLQDRMAKVQSR